MFDPAAMQTQLKEAFAGFSRHSDFSLVRLALSHVIGGFSKLSHSDRIAMGAVIKADFISTLEGDEPPIDLSSKYQPLTREERIRLHLEIAQYHPELMERFNAGFKTIALRHSFSEAVGIPAYATLTQYPQLTEGLKAYVAAYVNKHAIGMPYLARQLEGTAHAPLINSGVISKYRDGIAQKKTEHVAQSWGVLKSQPQHWAAFEKAATGLQFFGTYIPAMKTEHVLNGSFDYLIDYDERTHIIAVDFRNLHNPHRSSWVHLVPEEHLHAAYILLNHTLGALEGQRPGALSTETTWRAMQLKHLKPVLEQDVAALSAQITAMKWQLPYTPRAIMPTNP